MLFILEILAPISRRGSMIRPIGREFKDVSPERVVEKFCPARIPEIKRVVVPLFPVFKVSGKTGEGYEEVAKWLQNKAKELNSGE